MLCHQVLYSVLDDLYDDNSLHRKVTLDLDKECCGIKYLSVFQSYEGERRQHRDLKHTWQRANDQFLEAQRLHLADMRRMQALLTQDQLHKLEGEPSLPPLPHKGVLPLLSPRWNVVKSVIIRQ